MDELPQFLLASTRVDVKIAALGQLAGYTNSCEGRRELSSSAEVLQCITALLTDPVLDVVQRAARTLVNLSGDAGTASLLLSLDKPKLIPQCLTLLTDPQCSVADLCVMVLSNVTRCRHNCQLVTQQLEGSDVTLDKLVYVFTHTNYNKKQQRLHCLGAVLANLSQLDKIRSYLLDESRVVIARLLPYTEYQESHIRRYGIIATLKNCCFNKDSHSFLLGGDVDLLPHLLLPLAGGEQFDDEDNDKLPLDLQYLPDDKTRETDADIRKMIIEALIQLCALRSSREFMRDKNAYVILKEYHKWETDETNTAMCEDLVNLLIRTEDEIGSDDLHKLDIPDDIMQKFNTDTDKPVIMDTDNIKHDKT